jgi:hypothetical protein
MKLDSLLFSSVLAASPFVVSAQGLWCYPQARMAVFSNYDGGRLTINVDQDIPDLHIGVLSYEFARVYITGQYAANVSAVHYAGFNGSNDHCEIGGSLTTSIIGVPASAVSIVVYPPATVADPNGWPSMICAYSCEEGSDQGGCNTAAQAVGYFQSLWGLAPLFHRTQYECWGEEWLISEGGNCCSGALSTGTEEAVQLPAFDAQVISEELMVRDACGFRVMDGAGRVVSARGPSADAGPRAMPLHALPDGAYVARADDGRVLRFVLAR